MTVKPTTNKQDEDQVSQLLATSKRLYAQPSVDRAALKDGNMNDIMHYNYMRDFVKVRHDQDREAFLDNKIRGIKPIFKNFQDNNTNILRSEIVSGKLQSLRDHEAQEAEIQSVLMNQTFTDPRDGSKTIKYRCFDPEGVARVKPVRAVETLMNQTASRVAQEGYESVMSKTTRAGGFGLKKTTPTLGQGEDRRGKTSNLLEKIRRNQHSLAQSSNAGKAAMVAEETNEDYLDVAPGTPAGGARRAASSTFAVDPKQLYKNSIRSVVARPVSSLQASRMLIQQRNSTSGQGNRSALAMLSPMSNKALSNKGEVNLETEDHQHLGTT